MALVLDKMREARIRWFRNVKMRDVDDLMSR